jgi:predicted MFS family arabinose efflux permease
VLQAGRSPKPTPLVIAGYVAYAAVGWFLSGLGSVLPELDEQIGGWSAIYPLLPGAVLLAWGISIARTQRTTSRLVEHGTSLGIATSALALASVVMGVTGWVPVSVLGGVAAAVSAAWLIRLLPAALAIARPADTERVMMRANAWSSLASIVAPVAIGTTIGLGLGWAPGMDGPLLVAAVVVVVASRTGRPPRPIEAPEIAHTAVPPLRNWWRAWTVLTLSIVIEFCFAYYAATFLADEVGLSNAAAAAGSAAWGVGMALGRFLVSSWPPPRTLLPTVVLAAVGFVLFWGIATPVTAIVGLGLAGVAVSPLYPTRMTALLARFPAAPDQASTRGSIASGAALLGAPALMATIRALTDVRTAYLAVPVLLIVLVVLDRPEAARRSPG